MTDVQYLDQLVDILPESCVVLMHCIQFQSGLSTVE